MNSSTLRSAFLFSILLAALVTAVYLLLHHFALTTGQSTGTNICSAVFQKSCDAALMSRYSLMLGIPLGGWGILYVALLGLCLLMGIWLSEAYESDMLQTAWWIAVAGCAFSAYYLLQMTLHPVLLCPLCIVFHGLNFTFLLVLKLATERSWPALIKNLWAAVLFVLLGKQTARPFARWKWLGYVILVLSGLVLYQRIRMEVLNQNIIQLAKYNPLKQLEAFDTLAVHTIPTTPDEAVLGPADAPVSLVVFSDFQCSVCKMFAENFEELVAYNKGKLNIRFKHFPLNKQCNPRASETMHPMSCPAAWIAQAARKQGKFWPVHDALFNLNLNKIDVDALPDSLKIPGLNMDVLLADFASDSCRNSVAMDIQEGHRLGVNSTPTVFLNGRKVGDLRPDNLNFLVRHLLGPPTTGQ